MRGTPRRPPDAEWEGTWLGEGVGMDHGKGAGTTEPPLSDLPADAGPINLKPGGIKTTIPGRPYCWPAACCERRSRRSLRSSLVALGASVESTRPTTGPIYRCRPGTRSPAGLRLGAGPGAPGY